MSIDIRFSDIKAMNPKAFYSEDCVITRVNTDTRHLQNGDTFVAIKGLHFDGHDYVQDAVAGGATSAVVSESNIDVDAPVLQVDDTVIALGSIAALYRNKLEIPVVGITGSNGKTTVKDMLASIGAVHGEVTATRANQNNKIGVPLTLLSIGRDDDLAIIEMGTSEQGEIAYLSKLVSPDIAVVTSIAESHLEGIGSLDDVFHEKSDLIAFAKHDGVIVIAADQPYSDRLADVAGSREVIRYGFSDTCDIQGFYVQTDGGQQVRVKYPDGELQYGLQVLGEHNVLNSMAAVAVALKAGIGKDDIVKGLEGFSAVNGRLAICVLGGSVRLIDDSYNANPASTQSALKVLSKFTGRKILVFGGMAELGERSASLHQEVGRNADQLGIDEMYVLESAEESLVEFGGSKHRFENIDAMCRSLLDDVDSGDNVLVKGSRRYAMDKVVRFLKENI